MKKPKKWIEGAVERPGALHEALGVPEGEKIPQARIDSELKKLRMKQRKTAAEKRLQKQLNLANTLKGMG